MMTDSLTTAIKLAVIFILLFMVPLGCTNGSGSGTSSLNSALSANPVVDYSKFAKATTVCSPLNGASNLNPSPYITYANGLTGRVYSLNSGATIPQNLAQQFASSSDVGINLFLNDLNVPTRLFSEGFPNAAGQLLADSNGNTLVEYFGIQVSSSIQLTATDAPGPYQLALISDDGSTLSVKTFGNNNYTTLINDDGTHPSKMTCASSPVTLSTYDQIPIQVQYFQGPRYEIALMLMWRPWPKNAADVQDPLCGTEGNYQFFNPNVSPPTPQSNYQALLARGWKPLLPTNYVIPELGFNPCVVPGYFTAQ